MLTKLVIDSSHEIMLLLDKTLMALYNCKPGKADEIIKYGDEVD